MLDEKTKKKILTAQRNEITEHLIYDRLSQSIKDPHNKEILKRISNDELEHHNFWKEYTDEVARPDKLKIWMYYLISRTLGITFGIKLMETGEGQAQITYEEIAKVVPAAEDIAKDEDEHEKQLISLIDEERLRYIGAIIRGLNDALIELTGALAGLTLALQNARLVATTGLIIGIAAALSMGGTEYLATKSEEGTQNPLKSAIYTGFAYVITVLFLIFPYLLFANIYLALGITILNAIMVILMFNFYISVAREVSFKKRFLEMALLSLGIAALTFGIGLLVRIFLHVEI